LDIDEDTAKLLADMSAATIDRRLAPERKKYLARGRSRTKPGTLLKSQIPVRTWADWDDAVPGFVEIDLVSHDGGHAVGEHVWTLTVTDIATGWTEGVSHCLCKGLGLNGGGRLAITGQENFVVTI
jgi:hypothetical protein